MTLLYSMVMFRACGYRLMEPARSCKCCCSGPVASLKRTTIFTCSDSFALLSLSYFESSNSHSMKDSSKLFVLNVGLRSFFLFSTGMEDREGNCLYISKLLACLHCLHIVAAAPVVMLIRMPYVFQVCSRSHLCLLVFVVLWMLLLLLLLNLHRPFLLLLPLPFVASHCTPGP